MHRRLLLRLVQTCLLATAVLYPVTIDAASACATGPGSLYLADFKGGPDAGSLFYAAAEGSQATATIRIRPGDCLGPHETGNYATANGTALGGQDYTPVNGSTTALCDDVHYDTYCGGTPRQYPVSITTTNDSGGEAALEAFTFNITSASAGLDPPSSAPVYVVDTDGSTRATLLPGVTYSRSETFPMIRIPVFLAGPSPGSVGYTLTPDPAAPATPGQDFNDLTGGVVSIGGDRVGFIDLGIVNDELGEGPESVGITLTGPVDGSGSTSFTILDNEENEFPISRFHHPREGWRYKKSDYRIREFHVFTSDNPGGSGVVAAEIAIRKNMKNKDCIWLTKDGWQKKDCSTRVWLGTTYDKAGDLFRLPMKQLKSSVGTNIRDYTAYSRAIDGAGNVEKEFAKKRNANTFEIKRARGRR